MSRGLVSLVLLAASGALLCAPPTFAYPEFEAWVEATSGRYVDCAFCHTHADGPEGVKPGQIRSLDPAELERLGHARAAFEPGEEVDSPILNAFGNHVMERVGKRRFLEIRATDPGLLVEELGMESDLDGDGIPDAVEYREGTHPLDERHGAPLRLLRHNLVRYAFELVMIALATVFGLYGLDRLLEWAAVRVEEEPSPPQRTPTRTGGGTIP